jgi:hypothetical protein
MADVIDSSGRTFSFDRIRFKMDESLLQQASLEVRDQTKGRGQLVFDRYCHLHLHKFRRNYEPAHFSNGCINPRYQYLYENQSPAIRITIDITSGDIFDQYIGTPIEEIEAAIKRDSRVWFNAGHVVAVER